MELRWTGMMWKTRTYATASALPAIAAALALSSTPAWPQEVQPIVDARPRAEAAPAPEAAQPILPVDETTLMLGGGALALLALGGGALAMTRRRRQEGDEMMVDQSMTIDPVPSPRHDAIHEEQPAIVVPSAFAWGEPQRADRKVESRQGETRVERAYRGPTPDNPSLSLRKRLKRANFFDARDRRVAAGKAEPVPTDAGLPENVEVPSASRERELELA